MFAYLWRTYTEGKVINLLGVQVRSNEPFERALKRFIKTCEKNGIISDVKNRQRFEKPCDERKRHNASVRRKRRKELSETRRQRLY
jgi:small subunit ribosomal protein S21